MPTYGTKLASPALSYRADAKSGVTTFAWLIFATFLLQVEWTVRAIAMPIMGSLGGALHCEGFFLHPPKHGGFRGEGGSPGRRMRWRACSLSGSGTGTALTSALV